MLISTLSRYRCSTCLRFSIAVALSSAAAFPSAPPAHGDLMQEEHPQPAAAAAAVWAPAKGARCTSAASARSVAAKARCNLSKSLYCRHTLTVRAVDDRENVTL
jgi:hypothetical protein